MYADVIRHSAAMVSDTEARRLAAAQGLDVLNVTWEDTGRFAGSCVGPNISDMTIQVEHEGTLTCMPVIRFPNFADVTGDVALDDFQLLVGNERGADLRPVSLRTYLDDLRAYLSTPDSWTGEDTSLLDERDSDVLVSAQACFLPIPRQGSATFNPVLFNYQSGPGAPAVLTILATREGTSATIIDNTRDGFAAGGTWGQRLFFNADGERCSLTGERLSDFRASEASAAAGPDDDALNMVLLIQVPLVQPEGAFGFMDLAEECGAAPAPLRRCRSGSSDVEAAVIGHGEVEGPFTEVDGLAVERDTRFPIRVTVQFYKATSNGVVSETDLVEIKRDIDRVYADASFVGSLVVGGRTGRTTEMDPSVPREEPKGWWADFFAHLHTF